MLRTPFGAPKANTICERFMGSLSRECLPSAPHQRTAVTASLKMAAKYLTKRRMTLGNNWLGGDLETQLFQAFDQTLFDLLVIALR